MKILVTGGAGFIGSHIVDALLERGHEVHILDDFSTGKEENIGREHKLFRMDVQDPNAAETVRQEAYEVIFHQAAQMDVRRSVANPQFDARVNILGGLNLLEAANTAGCRKFIFASSGGTVYGEQVSFPAPETHPTRPLSPYGIAKLSFEHYLYYFQQVHNLPYVALRYANVYGPRQNPKGEAGVVAIFAERMLNGVQAYINGDGLQTRDYVHVADVVVANMAALENDITGAFNVGTGLETDVVTIFRGINAALGNPIAEEHAPAKAGEQRRSVIDPSRLQQATGWAPEYEFTEGLQQTVEWFRQQHRSALPK